MPKGEKNAAKTACPHGHEYTPENTIHDNGQRRCRTCRRDYMRVWMRKKRGSVVLRVFP